jgi:hypothetical protein
MYFLAAARMDRKYRATAMVGSSYDRDYIIFLQRDHAAHNVPGFSYTYCKLGNKTLLLQPGLEEEGGDNMWTPGLFDEASLIWRGLGVASKFSRPEF